ncbi:hypothetical protein [Tenacibaculum sp. nBUS_03]|uniref:hypothetical protein n=1 Tax=Tenacibaculum sp. nBUS_03 TaxID=3395320 RepID=UPI003EBC7C36
MIDTTKPITDFIKNNFQPSTPENANHKLSSEEVLELLFTSFPKDSIDTYDLYNILTSLGYLPQKDSTDENGLSIVWCFIELAETSL